MPRSGRDEWRETIVLSIDAVTRFIIHDTGAGVAHEGRIDMKSGPRGVLPLPARFVRVFGPLMIAVVDPFCLAAALFLGGE